MELGDEGLGEVERTGSSRNDGEDVRKVCSSSIKWEKLPGEVTSKLVVFYFEMNISFIRKKKKTIISAMEMIGISRKIRQTILSRVC